MKVFDTQSLLSQTSEVGISVIAPQAPATLNFRISGIETGQHPTVTPLQPVGLGITDMNHLWNVVLGHECDVNFFSVVDSRLWLKDSH
jgi:hypothetical protein